jgi:hypothetical protein
VVVRYTYFVADVAPDRVRAILRGRVSPETEEALMTTTAERLMAQGRAEGEARGRAEGEARGRAEGEARGRAMLLLKQLTLKHGALPPSIEERVRNASVAELDLWAERFVTATTLESIFA